MDIVLFIQQEVELLGWVFSYGNKSNINLIDGDKDIEKIYFLCDVIPSNEPDTSEFGGDGAVDYTLNFMLLVHSDFSDVYFKQRNTEEGEGKYEKNILPLKTQLKKFKKVIDCSIYERRGWSIVEVIDKEDFNGDGLGVGTTLREIE